MFLYEFTLHDVAYGGLEWVVIAGSAVEAADLVGIGKDGQAWVDSVELSDSEVKRVVSCHKLHDWE